MVTPPTNAHMTLIRQVSYVAAEMQIYRMAQKATGIRLLNKDSFMTEMTEGSFVR